MFSLIRICTITVSIVSGYIYTHYYLIMEVYLYVYTLYYLITDYQDDNSFLTISFSVSHTILLNHHISCTVLFLTRPSLHNWKSVDVT